ncbi:hypothetical protein M8C21_001688 [Ambrosia artemisiifolia]|uniref:WRC domain-containing protein n=1 Tax=Ambrosia artemisiifolia TaxID=4212 RepID=A0AAD5DDI6_AMBAR|nr:hypothetical protein M8C21_001688 [Ambrosia artemisiifolia]
MRIRKRFLSLYGSLTAPLLSDLYDDNHNHNQQPPWVQHQELHPNDNISLPQSSSNQTMQIGPQPDTPASSGDHIDQNKTKIFNKLETEKIKEPIKTDCRKESILCAEEKNHDLVIKGWLPGDKLVPTKKKRGSYGKRLNNEVVQDDEMVEREMKLKDMKKNNKKEKREGVIMEGSRCSRVNGRGWRCSQQTLVGYSLCEHHLGKGRVRNNMSTSHARTLKIGRKGKSPSIDHDDEVKDDDNEDDDEEAEDDEDESKDWDVESMSSMEGTKVFGKKKKIGVVKARSLSSLLSQISN